MDKFLLVVAGPSGCGKTAVTHLLARKDSRFTFLRSATTRRPRGDGNDGEYLYLTKEAFESLREQGGFVESTEYNGELYGTPLAEVERASSEGKIPLLVLDINGARSLRSRSDLCAFTVYIYSDLNAIEERLYSRYLGDSPSPQGLAAFVDRKERNVKDYLLMPEQTEAFCAFVCNDSTLDDLGERIASSFDAFCADRSVDHEQNAAVARLLHEMAVAKLY